ncbi:MAG: hypothetical protein ACR2GP_00210 [Burkholderiaceae bacterium]
MQRPIGATGALAALALSLISSMAVAQTADVQSLQKSGDAVIEALRRDDLAAIERRFDARMRDLFPPDKFAASWERIRSQADKLQRCGAPSSRPRDVYTILEYLCDFEHAPMSVRLAWAASGELSGLIFSAADEDPVAAPASSSAAVPTPAPVAPTVGARVAPTAAAPGKASTPGTRSTPASSSAAAPAPAPSAATANASPGRPPEELITTGAPGWPLPGSLVLPSAGGRAPAVVFVQDSGSGDRDTTIGPNKPLRDIANGLASRGIASVRYEKRTRALGQRFKSELPNWTFDDDAVDDAVAALGLLAARNDVGPLFIVGHGLGAILAPRIAASAAGKGIRVAGVVMLAAAATEFADMAVYQVEFLYFLPISTTTRQAVEDVKARRENVRRLVEQGRPDVKVDVKGSAKSGAKSEPKSDPASTALLLDMPASAWLDIGRYDPAAALIDQPSLPALLIFGGRDFQVPITEKRLWEARLGVRPDTTLVEFPSVSHLMIDGKGSMSPAEYEKPGHVSQEVIDRIAAWIKARS